MKCKEENCENETICFYSVCASCLQKKVDEYYQKHPEKLKQIQHATPEHVNCRCRAEFEADIE